MKKFELVFREGIFKLNPNNLSGAKDWNDSLDNIRLLIDDAKRQKKKFDKCSSLTFILGLQSLGNAITKKCFFDILDYIDLTFEDFIRFEEFMRNKESEKIHKLHFDWLKGMR